MARNHGLESCLGEPWSRVHVQVQVGAGPQWATSGLRLCDPKDWNDLWSSLPRSKRGKESKYE